MSITPESWSVIVFSNPSGSIREGINIAVIGVGLCLVGFYKKDLVLFCIGFCFFGIVGVVIGLGLIFARRDIRVILANEKLIINHLFRKEGIFYKDIDNVIDGGNDYDVILVLTSNGRRAYVYKWILKGYEEAFKAELHNRIEYYREQREKGDSEDLP